MRILVDADACPVKEEVYRVAQRYGCRVTLVANSWMRIPQEDWLELVIVENDFDAADDWIAEQTTEGDIVITGDIPLADRCLKKTAWVLDLRGGVFSRDSIGEAMASRELLSHLRETGAVSGGPSKFEKRNRSLFLQRLDQTIQAALREPEGPGGRK